MKIDFSQVVNLAEKEQADIAAVERTWRGGELARADVQLNKVQDGTKGLGTVEAWRKYRIALRDWPEHPKFPDTAYRPLAPDAEV